MHSSVLIFLSISFFFFIQISSNEAAPHYLHHDCPNASLFTPGSTYRSRLLTLLTYLSSVANHSPNGYGNATMGQDPPDQARGFFLCRGDLDITACGRCVATGKQGILRRCPNQRTSVIWYNECLLRYSNQSIFSAMERSPNLTFYNVGNVTDPTRFMHLLGQTLKDVTMRASAGGLGKKFAVAEANYTNSQKLYALAQCTPDLTASDCVACLKMGIAGLPEGKQGGRLLTPSCIWRYELYPFYNASALPPLAPPPPAPAPPPLAPVTTPEGT